MIGHDAERVGLEEGAGRRVVVTRAEVVEPGVRVQLRVVLPGRIRHGADIAWLVDEGQFIFGRQSGCDQGKGAEFLPDQVVNDAKTVGAFRVSFASCSIRTCR